MADASKIEWTDATWNPVTGCSVVSPGCTNCYAMRMAYRLASMAIRPDGEGNPHLAHYVGLTERSRKGKPVWTGKVALSEEALAKPLRRRKPTVYFVNSMADLFHESVPDEWIDRVFAVMALCPQHRFQVLTKRSARMREYLTAFAGRAEEFGKALAAVVRSARLPFQAGIETIDDMLWPLPNVWPGVSVEDQQRADERIPDLLATPAAVRWLSCEPLLGPVDLTRIHEVFDGGLGCSWESCLNGRRFDVWGEGEIDGCTKIDWVIAGGESGPAARPMHPEWARGLRDQCAAAGVPFFFKQWGEWVFESQLFGDPDEGIFDASGTPRPGRSYLWPGEGEWMSFKVGKKRAGRLLDGVEHNGMPA